jgi:hypothetical protein
LANNNQTFWQPTASASPFSQFRELLVNVTALQVCKMAENENNKRELLVPSLTYSDDSDDADDNMILQAGPQRITGDDTQGFDMSDFELEVQTRLYESYCQLHKNSPQEGEQELLQGIIAPEVASSDSNGEAASQHSDADENMILQAGPDLCLPLKGLAKTWKVIVEKRFADDDTQGFDMSDFELEVQNGLYESYYQLHKNYPQEGEQELLQGIIAPEVASKKCRG